MSTTSVSRSLRLAAAPDEVRRALDDDDLLGAWLGPWTSHGPTRATVTTDDGTTREVRREPSTSADEVRWTWWPEDDHDAASTVVIRLRPDGEGTRLTVTETARASGGVALDGLAWAVATLALEVALLLRTAVRV